MSRALRVPASLADKLGFNLHRAGLLAMRSCGLTPEQWRIMRALADGAGPLPQSDIASLTLKDKRSVSRMLARPERKEWISRAASRTDGRAASVCATPEGLDMLAEAERAAFLAFLKKLLRRLGEEDADPAGRP